MRPITVGNQRASALRFDDPRVQALLLVLVMYLMQTDGFTSKQLKEPLAQLLGIAQAMITRARMTYDLRRLRLHGKSLASPNTRKSPPEKCDSSAIILFDQDL